MNKLNIASFVASILSLLVAVISIVVRAEIATFIFCGCIIALIIALIIFYLISKKSNIKQSNSSETLNTLNSSMKSAFCMYEKADKGILEDKKSARRFFTDEFTKLLDNLCATVKNFTKIKFSSCLKLLNFEKDKDILECDITTVVRSSNSHHDRKSTIRRTKASANTEFEEILEDNHKNFFICRDLSNYANDSKIAYKNANDSYAKYYKSVVVVPVALETAYNKQDINDENIIFGFLCIDSKSSFKDRDADILLETTQLYATIICGILQKYKNLEDKYLYEIFA